MINKIYTILITLVAALLLVGCNVYRVNRVRKCCENLRANILTQYTSNKEFHTIRSAFVDSINVWSDMKLKYTGGFKKSLNDVDSLVLFNSNKTKALLFYYVGGSDRLKLITGEKTAGSWNFMYVGLPTFVFGSDIYTKNKVTYYTLKRLGEDGMLNSKCSIVDAYIDEKWFTDNLKKLHNQFLMDKLY